ncbi:MULTISPECIES: hypothetical protein [Chelativorans]|jgi:hypothetical protein|uniref:Uncharacterized protein n=1 Tax=Chelativorans sp. (strain BNC1) TaxID=266779 RepID=Q11BB7_CHESB|nr:MULTISPECIES: hypothetical protein [Chelativorans]
MQLSAPTTVVFLIALILAIVSLLPVLGITLGGIGAYSYWILFVGFVVLLLGNLMKGL